MDDYRSREDLWISYGEDVHRDPHEVLQGHSDQELAVNLISQALKLSEIVIV